jgi:predicted secreted protein
MQRRTTQKLLTACLLTTSAAFAGADTPAPIQGVLSLSTSASVEVTKDILSIGFSVTRDGPDAAGVQNALKQALDAALAEARKSAKPGQIEVQTGNFSLFPRYAPKGGVINGWQGTAELVIEGRDIPGIAQLSGRIQSMSISRVAYALSREAREKVEADVTATAIARYRAKAGEMSKAFGYSGYVIREVNVSTNEPPPYQPMMRAQAMAKAEDALPVEPGKGSVTANVSGSIQMK